MEARLDQYKDLKLKLDGMVPPGHNLLFDALYSSLPRDPQVKVQIYNAEIVPGGYTMALSQRRGFFCRLARALRSTLPGRRAGESEGR